jgi:hypothetical protein
MDFKDAERDRVDCSGGFFADRVDCCRLVHGMNQWRLLLLTVKNRIFYIIREKS